MATNTLSKLLKKKKLTGEEVGKIILLDLVNSYKNQPELSQQERDAYVEREVELLSKKKRDLDEALQNAAKALQDAAEKTIAAKALAASFDTIKELFTFEIKIARGHENLVKNHLSYISLTLLLSTNSFFNKY